MVCVPRKTGARYRTHTSRPDLSHCSDRSQRYRTGFPSISVNLSISRNKSIAGYLRWKETAYRDSWPEHPAGWGFSGRHPDHGARYCGGGRGISRPAFL